MEPVCKPLHYMNIFVSKVLKWKLLTFIGLMLMPIMSKVRSIFPIDYRRKVVLIN